MAARKKTMRRTATTRAKKATTRAKTTAKTARKAIQIMDEEILFRKINIKDFTKRKNLEIIRARLIGTRGRTKKTIESISGCNIIINENEVGLICHSEKMEYAITAISNIIKGSKVTNTYKYLEKTNKKGKIKKR